MTRVVDRLENRVEKRVVLPPGTGGIIVVPMRTAPETRTTAKTTARTTPSLGGSTRHGDGRPRSSVGSSVGRPVVLAALLLAGFGVLFTLGGCYERVISAKGIGTSDVTTYEPNVKETGPTPVDGMENVLFGEKTYGRKKYDESTYGKIKYKR